MNTRSSEDILRPESTGLRKTTQAYNKSKLGFLAFAGSLGGICLGYNTCIIASALIFIEKDFPTITNTVRQLFVSLTIACAAIGAIFGGILADRIGRKTTIIVSDLFLILGPGILWSTGTLKYLLLGRVLIGFGLGISALVSTIFLSETAPSRIRGAVVGMYQVMIALGVFFAFGASLLAFKWKLMVGLGLFPAALQFLLVGFFLQETPYFLQHQKEDILAEHHMREYYNTGSDRGSQEFYFDVGALRQFQNEEGNIIKSYSEIFSKYRRNLNIGCMLHILQQLSGINIILYYGPQILRDAGFGNNQDSRVFFGFLFLGLIYLLSSIFALFKIDTVGRRELMLRCLPFIVISMLLVTTSMFLRHYFDYWKLSGLTSFFGAVVFLMFYSNGFQIQPWLIASEIFPVHIKGQANGLISFVNWSFNFLLTSLFFAMTLSDLGKVITYSVLAVINLFSIWFAYNYVGETKGLIISECIKLYQHYSGSETFKHSKEAITRMLDNASQNQQHPHFIHNQV
ncbi:inositol transporter 1-like [Stylonychia lemnae]|uniref:Hexose transporter 1 n=1 Tax=Stylonychia lemnae TaxID=5949 RepID=A0A078B578_STYLE|nr:inositol transporter 1-like [Stylonychia lemnae]|eukprot:CDW88412.1 inositol transporter 1-like [Stylonychia lemnae]